MGCSGACISRTRPADGWSCRCRGGCSAAPSRAQRASCWQGFSAALSSRCPHMGVQAVQACSVVPVHGKEIAILQADGAEGRRLVSARS